VPLRSPSAVVTLVTTLAVVDGKVCVVLSVPARVSELLTAKVLPLAIDSVPVVAPIFKPLMVVELDSAVGKYVAPTVPLLISEPAIDFPLRVWVSVVPTIAPEGAVNDVP
jgi:hypothetical protein